MNKFLFLGLFLISAVSRVLSLDYNDTLARYKIWPMASAAYGDPKLCVKDNFAHGEFIGQYTVKCDLIPLDSCSGFTAVSHSDKAIIISFRGSTSSLQIVDEILDDLLQPPSPFGGGGGVNKYFMDAFNDIWKGGMKNDFNTVKNTNPDYEVWVTGHSLGAAVASVAAASISYLGYMPPEKIKLVSFGQPRVGTTDYAAAVDTLLPYSIRVVHRNDLIAQLPPKGLLGYIHHKSEVWYNNNMTVGASYTTCDVDEGEGCSDSTLDLSMEDHTHYFNKPSGFAMLGCAGYNPNP